MTDANFEHLLAGKPGRLLHWSLSLLGVGIALSVGVAWGSSFGRNRAEDRVRTAQPQPQRSSGARLRGGTKVEDVRPKRTSSVAGVRPLPALPHALEAPPSLALSLLTKDGANHILQRTRVMRSAERMWVRFEPEHTEWYFERNPIDHRRVSGVLVHHRRHTLVEYSGNELEIAGLGRGWSDVASLGIRREDLDGLEPVGNVRELSGYHFEALRPTPRATAGHDGIRELWWSQKLSLPLKIVEVKQGATRDVEVERLSRDVDEAVLRDPGVRFPRYARMDVADFREKHHEHSAEPRGTGHGAAHPARQDEAGPHVHP